MEKLSAKNANTTDAICLLERDNYDSGGYSILVTDKEVFLCDPTTNQKISISKKNFDKLMDFYLKEQPTRKQ